jgi:hypothetical protein
MAIVSWGKFDKIVVWEIEGVFWLTTTTIGTRDSQIWLFVLCQEAHS